MQYEYRDHCDGTKLHGHFFAVDALPNPAYWDVTLCTERLESYHIDGSLPQDFDILHADANNLHNNERQTDVNGQTWTKYCQKAILLFSQKCWMMHYASDI